jgi:hypothetical protein
MDLDAREAWRWLGSGNNSFLIQSGPCCSCEIRREESQSVMTIASRSGDVLGKEKGMGLATIEEGR